MRILEIPGGSQAAHASLLQECGRDSCLRVVLCYKQLFTKACIGCKRFFLKESSYYPWRAYFSYSTYYAGGERVGSVD